MKNRRLLVYTVLYLVPLILTATTAPTEICAKITGNCVDVAGFVDSCKDSRTQGCAAGTACSVLKVKKGTYMCRDCAHVVVTTGEATVGPPTPASCTCNGTPENVKKYTGSCDQDPGTECYCRYDLNTETTVPIKKCTTGPGSPRC